MEAAAVARSFHGAMAAQRLHTPSLDKRLVSQVPVAGRWSVFFSSNQKGTQLPTTKASGATIAAKLDSDKVSMPLDKKTFRSSFPDAFEKLVLEVCDETQVAEVKLKVGDFEMHLKRNVGASKAPTPIVSPTTAPPIPSEPMVESATAAAPLTPPKSSSAVTNHFTYVSSATASKLAALEASGSKSYAIVSSPTVGSFRSGRTVKGKRQPPCCKEGDMIKEGQIIGYLDQFGSELPVKSDVAGEVLKVLFKDGEAVGFGDPLVAVLPSFHGINK